MGIEIERKFLVKEGWLPKTKGENIIQVYLCRSTTSTVRVRIRGKRGYLTVKSMRSGISRSEFEYEIPLEDARELLKLASAMPIDKTRYLIRGEDGKIWEVDVFHGANKGLILAEIELKSEDETFMRPDWLGKEVSFDARYYNSNLIKCPYSTW